MSAIFALCRAKFRIGISEHWLHRIRISSRISARIITIALYTAATMDFNVKRYFSFGTHSEESAINSLRFRELLCKCERRSKSVPHGGRTNFVPL